MNKEKKYSNCDGRPFIATKTLDLALKNSLYDNGISIPYDALSLKVAIKVLFNLLPGWKRWKKCGVTQQDICFGNKLLPTNVILKWKQFTFYLISYHHRFSRFESSMTGIIGDFFL